MPVSASLAAQRKIEAADTVDFETYRATYLAPSSLGLQPEPAGPDGKFSDCG